MAFNVADAPNIPTLNTMELLLRACEVHIPATPDQAEINVKLWEEIDKKVFFPRGILPYLLTQKTELTVVDRRVTWEMHDPPERKLTLRPHQEEQVQAILSGKEGIIVAPPGAGKTITVLEAIRRSGQKALIIVDRLNIATQWCDAWEKLTGDDSGCGIFDSSHNVHVSLAASPHRINIVLQQTLQKYTRNEIENLAYGFVCLDECHHVSAEGFTRTFGSFRARYRIGVSATPTRADGLEKISQLVIGPVLHRINTGQLSGSIFIPPRIQFVKTNFHHYFWGTHSVNTSECDVPDCKKIGKPHSHRNNYADVLSALVEDVRRNQLIVGTIRRDKHKCNLVVSDRLGHLDTLYAMCAEQVGNFTDFDPERLYMLTGREDAEERENVYRLARYGECVIFSTIAKEALDIPRLDRLYLTFPIKSDHILEQQIGRIVRAHPDKKDAVVYDFIDRGCKVLASQSYRRCKYYRKKNYEIGGW